LGREAVRLDEALGGRRSPLIRAKWRERKAVAGVVTINKLVGEFGLPDCVAADALETWKKVLEEGLVPRGAVPAAAACLVAACRRYFLPLSVEEVAEAVGISVASLNRAWKKIFRTAWYRPLRPECYVPALVQRLGLSEAVGDLAVKLIGETERAWQGCRPRTVAAAAVYMASLLAGERRDQREVAEAAWICDASLRKCFKKMAASLPKPLGVVA